MGLFSYFSKKRREQRRKLRELKNFSSVFSTLDRLEQSGLLVWDQKQRRLFINQSLAVLTLLKSPEAYAATVQNLYLWTYWQQIQQVTADTMLKAELAAVRKAAAGFSPEVLADGKRQSRARGSQRGSEEGKTERSFRPPLTPPRSGGETTSPLSRADVERIRIAARQQVAESDIEPPKVDPFEMFIVEDTVDAKPRIIAVGYFNPETNDMEIAPWSEIQPLLQKAEK